MKMTLSRSVAAGVLFVGAAAMPITGYVSSAMAQSSDSTTTQTTQKPKANATQAPASGNAMTGSKTDNTSAAAKSDSSPVDNAAKAANDENGTKAPADQAASTSSGKEKKIVTEQKENEVLASTYIGQTVYNANDKSIGDISDLVFDKNGGIKAAVIGVGGFLGIGQKNVAVAFDRIKIQRKPGSADVKLVSDVTAEQLKKAPAFKNLQTKMDEQNASKPAAGGGVMGTGGAAGKGGMSQ